MHPSGAGIYGMLPASTGGTAEGRTPNDNQAVRSVFVFVIGPDKRVKLVMAYPMSTGCNFGEVLRVIDALQRTAKHRGRRRLTGTRRGRDPGQRHR